MKINIKIHFAQLFDFDNPRNIRAFTTSFAVAVVAGGFAGSALRGYGTLVAILGALLAFGGTLFLLPLAILWTADSAARGAASFVAPSGSSTPSADDYSREKALIARGDVETALAEIEARLANRPHDAALCLFAADVYAREAGDAAKAERLYLHVREIRGVSPAQDYTATNRLIDLYMGALDDPARAASELERMRVRHAGTTAAAHAEQALRQLRGTPPSRPPGR
ncbi:hypothetical protein [Longimicrobium sp.]|uniref:hypothetical protein n=1 Tax=Longimicrobium sp. TaxID=2029185 RepID=UPI002BD64A56|nr:hypothetical protein [Longimicrobium sp.]HSU16430.1 hypothetical protein [Longimicrobium sp.]